MSPDDLTFRELESAAKAKLQHDWDHTAAIIAAMHNTSCKGTFHTNQFHPYRDAPTIPEGYE